jgi:hypothetical protein
MRRWRVGHKTQHVKTAFGCRWWQKDWVRWTHVSFVNIYAIVWVNWLARLLGDRCVTCDFGVANVATFSGYIRVIDFDLHLIFLSIFGLLLG